MLRWFGRKAEVDSPIVAPAPALRRYLEAWSEELADAHSKKPAVPYPGSSWATRALAARRIRRQTEAVASHLDMEAALKGREPQVEANREAADRFLQSLPPPTSRVSLVLGAVAMVIAIRLVTDVVAVTGFGGSSFKPLNGALARLTSGDVTSLADVADRMVHADPIELTAFLAVVSFLSFLFLAGVAIGHRRANRLTRVHEISGIVGARSPVSLREVPLDLAISALLAVGVLLYGAAAAQYQNDLGWSGVGREIIVAMCLAGVAGLGLIWIAFRWRRCRGAGFAPFVAICAGLIILLAASFDPTRLTRDERLEERRLFDEPYDPSLLFSQDLRGEQLDGADLRGGDLQGSNLTGMDLTETELVGANLHGAILRGANLFGAELCRARLAGADLADANLVDAIYDRDTTWPRRFSPSTAGARLAKDPKHCS